MEDLCVEVGEVGHDEDEDGLYDPDLVGVAGDHARGEPPDDPDDRPTHGHHDEGEEACQDVCVKDIGSPHLCVGLEHVVQYLVKQSNSGSIPV